MIRTNAEEITRRRQDMRLSAREVAKAMGIGLPFYQAIEAGQTSDPLTLGQLGRLASVLCCPAHALVRDEWSAEAAESTGSDVDGVAHVRPSDIGAAIARVSGPVPIAALCEYSGLERPLLLSILAQIDTHLASIGLRLVREKMMDRANISAHPDYGPSGAALKRLLRRSSSRAQLDLADAKIVYRAISGRLTAKTVRARNSGRVHLGKLIAAGIIEQGKKETDPLRVSDDVRRSLLLDLLP